LIPRTFLFLPYYIGHPLVFQKCAAQCPCV
jgi:hypothetical protein